MAASLAAVKKELRKKIKNILKELPDAAIATQCEYSRHGHCFAQVDRRQLPMQQRRSSLCLSTKQPDA